MNKDEMNLIRDLLVFNAIPLHSESFNKAIAILDAAIAAPEQEPFAWATFDGEGSYDLRLYECNEDYRAEYIKRNGDKYAAWVIPLYTAPVAAPEPQPDTWDGAEEWERLAFELCADEHGEESCNELIWSDFEPWGERWLKYEDEAKRMISLVRKHTAPVPAPQREWVSLTDEEIDRTFESKVWDARRSYARAIEAALKEKNHG